MLDVISILPFDVVGMAVRSRDVQKLKTVRIVRLMRLVKLVRVLRASRMVARWQNHNSMKYGTQALLKFFVLIVMSAHWMACIWGMAGV